MSKKIDFNRVLDEIEEIWENKSRGGMLLTYNLPREKNNFVKKLRKEEEHIRYQTVSDNLEEITLPKGIINCLDISSCSKIFSKENKAGKEIMGWLKSRKVILICKYWQWKLLKSGEPRWISHLIDIKSLSPLDFSIRETLNLFADKGGIGKLKYRIIIYEYLCNRSLFRRFLSSTSISSEGLKSTIEEKNLWALNEREKKILLKTNEEILRILVASKLNSRADFEFSLPQFRDTFGRVPSIGGNIDESFYDDILNVLNEWKPEDIGEFSSIKTLAALLFIDDYSEKLKENLRDFLGLNNKDIQEKLLNLERKDEIINRGNFISDIIEKRDIKSPYHTLMSIISFATMDEKFPFQLLNHYFESGVRERGKMKITDFLASLYKRGNLEDHMNFRKISEFLEESGPKIVLLIDGLSLCNSHVIQFLWDKRTDERWELNFSFPPVPSITDKFRLCLNQTYDLNRLGGFIDEEGENLRAIEIEKYLGENAEEITNLLNEGNNIVLYDNTIDKSGIIPSDVDIKIKQYFQSKIPQFISNFEDHADILIVSDHGLVKTKKNKAIEVPSGCNKRGLRHSRVCFCEDSSKNDKINDEDLKVSDLKVNLAKPDDETVMLNPNLPKSKFGSQQSDRWVHGGISVEECLLPFFIRRRLHE